MVHSLALLCYTESPSETDSMVRELELLGYQAEICTIHSIDDLKSRLSNPHDWQLVVVQSSYERQADSGIAETLRELAPDLPCILLVNEPGIGDGSSPVDPLPWSTRQRQLFGQLVTGAAERCSLHRQVAELEEALRRTRRLDSVGSLAGAMTHELNNLLTPILIAAELLAETEHDDETQGLLEGLLTGSRRAADTVKQLQNFVWGNSAETRDLDLRELMRDLEKLLRFSLPKTIKLEMGLPETSWWFEGKPAEWFQVILALAANAREAMPEGGTLTVKCDLVENVAEAELAGLGLSPADYLRILVSDTGFGMPPDVLAQAGEPFFTTKPAGRGLGLGLASSRALVARQGGALHVESTEGEGTRVAVYFPARFPTTPQTR